MTTTTRAATTSAAFAVDRLGHAAATAYDNSLLVKKRQVKLIIASLLLFCFFVSFLEVPYYHKRQQAFITPRNSQRDLSDAPYYCPVIVSTLSLKRPAPDRVIINTLRRSIASARGRDRSRTNNTQW
jgi:hypothetical protein